MEVVVVVVQSFVCDVSNVLHSACKLFEHKVRLPTLDTAGTRLFARASIIFILHDTCGPLCGRRVVSCTCDTWRGDIGCPHRATIHGVAACHPPHTTAVPGTWYCTTVAFTRSGISKRSVFRRMPGCVRLAVGARNTAQTTVSMPTSAEARSNPCENRCHEALRYPPK